MRAIFLCEKDDKIFKVYDEKAVCELQTFTNIEKKVYTKAEVLSQP